MSEEEQTVQEESLQQKEIIHLTGEHETTTTTIRKRFRVSWRNIQGEYEMEQTVLTRRASRARAQPVKTEEPEQEAYEEPVRLPSSARRYDRATPRSLTTQPLAASRWTWRTVQIKCLQILAGALCIALLLDTVGYAAWKAVSDHWTYGAYPTTHLTANFGHGGPSQVVAFMDGPYADIIELVGTKKASIYTIKISNAQKRVITLEVEDVNGDGKPDLLVEIEGVEEKLTLLNTGKSFEWSVPR